MSSVCALAYRNENHLSPQVSLLLANPYGDIEYLHFSVYHPVTHEILYDSGWANESRTVIEMTYDRTSLERFKGCNYAVNAFKRTYPKPEVRKHYLATHEFKRFRPNPTAHNANKIKIIGQASGEVNWLLRHAQAAVLLREPQS